MRDSSVCTKLENVSFDEKNPRSPCTTEVVSLKRRKNLSKKQCSFCEHHMFDPRNSCLHLCVCFQLIAFLPSIPRTHRGVRWLYVQQHKENTRTFALWRVRFPPLLAGVYVAGLTWTVYVLTVLSPKTELYDAKKSILASCQTSCFFMELVSYQYIRHLTSKNESSPLPPSCRILRLCACVESYWLRIHRICIRWYPTFV